MKIVAGMADAAGVFCEVSMERRMACGVGACLGCAVALLNEDGAQYFWPCVQRRSGVRVPPGGMVKEAEQWQICA